MVSALSDNMNKTKLGILTAIYTGVRIGELCGMKWSDIDASGFCKVCDDIGKGVENVWKSASEGVGNFFGGLFKW